MPPRPSNGTGALRLSAAVARSPRSLLSKDSGLDQSSSSGSTKARISSAQDAHNLSTRRTMAEFAPTEIFHAAASGDARQVQEWLAGGGDANADHPPDFMQYAPRILELGLRLLGVAAWHGRCEVIKLLLAAGADVNYSYRTQLGHATYHALLIAVSYGQVEAVRILVDNGADVNYDSNNPERREPPPECTQPTSSVALQAVSGDYPTGSGHPRILKMLLKAGLNTAARSCHTHLGLNDTPEEFARRWLELTRNEQRLMNQHRIYGESLEILERLRLAEDHILSVSKEFPPFRTLLWNIAFRNGGRIGPRTTDAISRLFGRNKTGALADVPDGVFWLIVQFFVAGEMRPHVAPVAST